MNNLVVYYEGNKSLETWLNELLKEKPIYKKLPTKNNSADYADLPAYVSDILYLDKPDLIIAMVDDGHEKPLLSIEFATCTPQYQHALQRFSRMVASAASGCPSVLIMANTKRSNDLSSIYQRSAAIDYGAVRLIDVFRTPCFVLDWPSNNDSILEMEEGTEYPRLNSEGVNNLKELISACIQSRNSTDYMGALFRQKIVTDLGNLNRARAYINGTPSIENPGGGVGKSQVKLDLKDTTTLIKEIKLLTKQHESLCSQVPAFITAREQSLVFYPTRITAHAGDPYVGMICYYDIAFTRNGPSTRDRHFNLVAYAERVSIDEVIDPMKDFVQTSCPFAKPLKKDTSKVFNYHLKNGCKETKSKPIRIYAEIADIVVFKDGVLFNAG